MSAGPKPRALAPGRIKLVYALEGSSGSWLQRIFAIQDHYLRGWSRLRPLEAVVVLKLLFGPT
jgi:hypothetical protein